MANDKRINPRAVHDRYRLQSAAKNLAKFGLASPEIAGKIHPGAVFVVKDEAIDFPEDALPGATRTMHETRRVIVCTALHLCQTRSPKSVMVVPCTASRTSAPASWHFQIPDGEPGFSADCVIALPQITQPILRSDLIKYVDTIRTGTLVALQAKIAEILGLISPRTDDLDAELENLEIPPLPGVPPMPGDDN